MKIIVTGAAGLVGQNIVLMLLDQDHNIIAIDKNEHNLNLLKEVNPQAQTILADLSEIKDWEHHFKNTDIVIQLQAQISHPNKELYIKNNINSIQNILNICEKYNIPNLIHLSSSVVISVANDNYTNTKRAGEELVKQSKVPHTILRPPLMYGCFDSKHLGFLTKILEKSPIFPVPGSGKYMRQPLYVLDLCNIILKLLHKKPENKIYNLIGKERIDFIDLMKSIAKTKKLNRLFLNIPLPIFSKLVKIYGLLTGKSLFIPDQLKALTAGDNFPIEPWEKTFGIPYTPFEQAIKDIYQSPYVKYNNKMISPN